MKYAAVIATVSAFASDNYCPAGVCYKDSGTWNPTTNDVTCTYDPASKCIVPTCSASGLAATFSPDLFHTNEFNSGNFGAQLLAGKRSITVQSGSDAGATLSQSGECSYSVDASGTVSIDWSFEKCSKYMNLELDNGNIVYTAKIQADGNKATDDTSNVIEFYIDTDAAASCSYPAEITVEKSFWINQEDVDASQNAAGDLDGEFGCKFYSDASRDANSEITSTNIVNMGVNIYGEVTSTALLGLSYQLTDVTISNNAGDEFSPIANSAGDPLVNGDITSDNPTATGNNILFEYLSFGFEQNSGKDQNQVSIKCHISLTVPDSDEEGSS